MPAGGNSTFTVYCGTDVTVTADDSDECCQFDTWSDGGDRSHTVHVDGDKNVTAFCSIPQYQLDVTSDGCCSVVVAVPLDDQLKLNGESEPDLTTSLNVTCVAPGDSDDVYVSLDNTGPYAGEASLHIMNLIDDDNGITEPEDAVSPPNNDGDDGTPYGDLSRNLDMTISADFGDGYVTVMEGKLFDITCVEKSIGHIDAGSSATVRIHWWVDWGVGNIIMTDTSTFDIVFSLKQTGTVPPGGNDTFVFD